MNHFREKLTLIFRPYLLLAALLIPAYTLLRWLLDVRLQLFMLDEDIWNFALPLVVSLTAVLVFLRRRLQLLLLTNGTFMHVLAAAGAIAVPIMVAQHYLALSAYPLVQLGSPAAAAPLRYERFYVIRQYYIDTLQSGAFFTSHVSGRHNEDLNLRCYVTLPVRRHAGDTLTPAVWYAFDFSRTISNRESDAVKEQAYQAFDSLVTAGIQTHDYASPAYFENIPEGGRRSGYLRAVRLRAPSAPGNVLILEPRYSSFTGRARHSFCWILLSCIIGTGIMALLIFMPAIGMSELDRYRHRLPAPDDDLQNVLQLLVPRGPHFMTALLIHANVLWYVVMVLKGVPFAYPNGAEVLPYGAVTYALFRQGDYWRLFTAIFVHFGCLHLVCNMVGLGAAGLLLERYTGRLQLLLGFIATGMAACYCGLLWHPDAVHAGASGAIFGLYGMAAAFMLRRRIPDDVRPMTLFLLVLFGGPGLVIGFLTPNTGNAAHMAGLAAGFVWGWVLTFLQPTGQR